MPALEWLKSGRVKALGVTSARRTKALPDVPAISESLPGFDATNWYGIMVPANTPRDITAKLNADIVRVLHSPEVRSRLEQEGGEVTPSTPEQFATFLSAEIVKWATIIREAAIQLD